MLEQLKELLEMQRVLDENILREKGITEYPLDNMKIALFVELGELMNEFPTKFKHWKSSAVDNREKGLVEYVDCLHFALSLANYYSEDSEKYILPYNAVEIQVSIESNTYMATLNKIVNYMDWNNIFYAFVYLFVLGNKLGFTWEEIYSAYKKKNEVNYQRLRNGY